jgi:hypothetical protein
MSEFEGAPIADRLATPETNSDNRHCIFIPGMQATNAGMQSEMGIGAGLVKAYGPDNVTTFNSVVSTDTPNAERFSQIASTIKERVRDGGVDIAVHSLGAAELSKVLKTMRKEDPGYFDDPKVKENLRFVLIGPSGFNKGLKEKFRYAKNILVINSKRAKGFDALTAFPPKGVTPEQLTQTFAADSNVREDLPLEQFAAPRTNEEFLSDADKEVLEQYDTDLQALVASSDLEKAQENVGDRAAAVAESLQQVYEGTPVKDEGPKSKTRMGGRAGLGILIRAAGKKPMEEFHTLAVKGYQVDFLVPEYDFVVPLEKVMKFFNGREGDAKRHIRVIQQSSHPGFALQPELYGKAIKDSNGSSASDSDPSDKSQ